MKVGDIVTINRDAVAKDHPVLQHGGDGEVMSIDGDRVWVKPSRASPIYIMTMDELVVEQPVQTLEFLPFPPADLTTTSEP